MSVTCCAIQHFNVSPTSWGYSPKKHLSLLFISMNPEGSGSCDLHDVFEVWSRAAALDWMLKVGVGSPHGKVKWMDFPACCCVHRSVCRRSCCSGPFFFFKKRRVLVNKCGSKRTCRWEDHSALAEVWHPVSVVWGVLMKIYFNAWQFFF